VSRIWGPIRAESSRKSGVLGVSPRWGSGGSTNLSTNETTGGEISAGGEVLAGGGGTFSGTTSRLLSFPSFSVAANASNPSDVRWGILYDNTSSGKYAIGFIDFDGVIDLAGGLTLNNPSGYISGTTP
jgi:hypothetical protein